MLDKFDCQVHVGFAALALRLVKIDGLAVAGRFRNGFTSNDVDLYDTTDPATFNKSTGTFIPKEGYTQYGAQR